MSRLKDEKRLDIKAAIRAPKPLIHRAEVGLATIHALALEPQISLIAADHALFCFSMICNKVRIQKKTKDSVLVAELHERVHQRASRFLGSLTRGGGGMGHGGGSCGARGGYGDGAGFSHGNHSSRQGDRDGRKREHNNRWSCYPSDEKSQH